MPGWGQGSPAGPDGLRAVVPALTSVIGAARQLVETPSVADELIERCLRRFTSVKDRGLRRTVLREFVDEVDDASLVALLHRLDLRMRDGDAACRWLATELALTPSVLRELPYLRIAEVYEIASGAGLPGVAARFLGGTGAFGPEGTNPHFERSAGERTAAARSRDRLVLDRIMHDRDARVIAVLLDNPRITEIDAIRVAAMNPTRPAILELLVSHYRWGRSYRVRKAVAFNPSTPDNLARQVLPTLLQQDLRDLVGIVPSRRADVLLLLQRRNTS